MKLLELKALTDGMIIRVNDPMRVGGDPGKWRDCGWAIDIMGPGMVVNLNGHLKLWSGDGLFKGIEVVAHVSPAWYAKKGMISISAGADSGYDVEASIEALISGNFDKRNIILATLSMIDLTPLRQHSLCIYILGAIPPGASVGSSAAVQVAILHALCGDAGSYVLAMAAVYAEIYVAKRAAGNQDPIATASGAIDGDACLSITIDSTFPEAKVEVLALGDLIRSAYDSCGVLTYLGSHDSSEEHSLARSRMEGDLVLARRALGSMGIAAERARIAILADNVNDFAAAMQLTCEAQRAIHPRLIGKEADKMIELAVNHGALCSMMPGAGGSGGSLVSLFSSAEQADVFAQAVMRTEHRPYRIQLTRSGQAA